MRRQTHYGLGGIFKGQSSSLQSDQFVIQDMVYEGLVRYGDNGKNPKPALAEKLGYQRR